MITATKTLPRRRVAVPLVIVVLADLLAWLIYVTPSWVGLEEGNLYPFGLLYPALLIIAAIASGLLLVAVRGAWRFPALVLALAQITYAVVCVLAILVFIVFAHSDWSY